MAVTSGIKTVTVLINGSTQQLTWNEGTQKYEATITAPAESSFNQTGHYFAVKVTAEDQAGNSVSKDDTDPTLGESLRLRVKEKVAPTISNIVPTNGAYISTSAPTITAELRDNNSGVKIESLVLKIDNVPVEGEITKNPVSGGYDISYTPTVALEDGPHTISIQVSDNDDNVSQEATSTFNVMTTAPVLEITSPSDGMFTNKAALQVVGTTNRDATVTIKLNSVDQGTVTVGGDGAFTKDLTLATEGENTIEITATNLAGVPTVVTRKVVYDVTAPVISAVAIDPNPVDAGKTYTISVTVTD